MFRTVLVANRGEIAVRVIQACAQLGVRSVAVYSEADADALHVRAADAALCIGPASAADSYLSIAAIITAALQSGAQAIHPGYGFLSENADFADACAEAGVVFIGPPPQVLRLMGSKSAAKAQAVALGIPVVPGYNGAASDPATLTTEAARVGYPLLIKAIAGGGGRGMRVVTEPSAFGDALTSAQREAQAAFGDGAVLLERYLTDPRHIEVQVMADSHGTVLHLGERECSLQRRHQKVIEEAPSPALTPVLRAAVVDAAVRLARAVGYVGAGTVEFLLDATGAWWFLEMNPRLQVEHGVTELVTGLDLVQLQLRVAAGEPLPITQAAVVLRGHAIEARVTAEDPAREFVPSSGRLTRFLPPTGPGIRNDVGFETGDTVTPHYDSLLAKLLVVGATRADALQRIQHALDRYVVEGVRTNLALLRSAITYPAVQSGDLSTQLLEAEIVPCFTSAAIPSAGAWAAATVALATHDGGDPWASGWRATGSPWAVRLAADAVEQQLTLARIDTTRWQVHLDKQTWTAERARNRVLVRDGQHQSRLTVTVTDDGVEVAGPLWTDAHNANDETREGGDTPAEAGGFPTVAAADTGAERVVSGAGDSGDETGAHAPRPSSHSDMRQPADADGHTSSSELAAEPHVSDVSPPQRRVGAGIGTTVTIRRAPPPSPQPRTGMVMEGSHTLTAPLTGQVIAVRVQPGDHVQERQPLVTLEAMKMEHVVSAPAAARVARVAVASGDLVQSGALLVELEPLPAQE